MGVIEIDSELLAQAREAGVDVSRVSEEALRRAVERARKRVILEEIRQDQQALTEYVAKHGNPAAELSEMFGDSGAAV